MLKKRYDESCIIKGNFFFTSRGDPILATRAGLEDTNGILFQIANLVGLEKALHNAKTVRVILMMH